MPLAPSTDWETEALPGEASCPSCRGQGAEGQESWLQAGFSGAKWFEPETGFGPSPTYVLRRNEDILRVSGFQRIDL